MFAADRQRDHQLMREVIWLLDHIMQNRPDLRDAFDKPRG